jgi:hypothetical protein
LNYTQAYKALRAYGCPVEAIHQALDDAEIKPARVMGSAGWIAVTYSTKLGFRLAVIPEEGKQ